MRPVELSNFVKPVRESLSVLLFGLLPIALVLAVMGWTYDSHTFVSDFRGDLYSAGRDILAARDPYRLTFLSHLAAVSRLGGHPSTIFAVPVYPAPDLVAIVPLSLLPYKVAGIVFTLLGIAATCLGLRLLGVRDWRCYGAAFLSWPVLHTLRLGQVNGFLLLAAAIAWRWRPRAIVAGAAVAAAVVAKVFLWPLGLFLVLTRRWRVAGVAALMALLCLVGAWAILGFAGFSSYARMLSDLSAIEGTAGISLLSFGTAIGISHTLATGLSALVTLGLIFLAWSMLKLDGGERSAFGLLVMAGLTSSSLVWPHYMMLLLIPIALLAPRFSLLWLVPLLGYLAPVELTHHHPAQIVPYLVMEAILVGALCRPLIEARRAAARSTRLSNRQRPEAAAGRMIHGLRSTSSRSYPAAHRPTRGPVRPPTKLPVGDRTAQTVNRRPV